MVTALILLTFLAMTAGAGVVSYRRSSQSLDITRAKIESLVRAGAGLAHSEEELSKAKSLRSEVDATIESLIQVKSAGIPLSASLGTTFGSFRSRAGLLAMSCSSTENGGRS